ncbi:MAG: SsgA family sporulation/cell division regulator [Nocardioidaceae bacterium]
MEMAPMSVTRTLTLELIDATGAATPLDAELFYDKCDPYAVAACFGTADLPVRWVFARDLLAEGLYEPTGDGDVHVWPCLDARGRAVVIIELSSPDGEALLQASSAEVCEFLLHAEAVVPKGTEGDHLNVDDTLARFFD